MNHKEKLFEVYRNSNNISDIKNIPKDLLSNLKIITSNIESNKGVYTVLVTLCIHKLLFPKQDIRYFQDKMENGFSGRSVDTKFITPTLKELGLPSMAESGWLTRSLEQPYPYTFDYKGEISGKGMKQAFLAVVDAIEKKPKTTESILRLVLNSAISCREENKVNIVKITNGDNLLISTIVSILDEHFNEKYKTHGGSKLPVLAFYAIYKSLIPQMARYSNCKLEPLGSHTASDRTSKSAGDIQITRNGKVFEVVEVKLDKPVDINIARIAYEKIARFNPERYYVLSYIGTKEEDTSIINELIFDVKQNHGCQLIVNGLIHSLKYYLRLIDDLTLFFNEYVLLVENDNELKPVHKNKLKELILKHNLL